MSACERFLPLLVERATGEIASGEAAPLEAHLSVCEACRREADELRAMGALLAEDAAGATPGGVADPGPLYWRGFAGRVALRLPPRESRIRPPAFRAFRPRARLALAAAVAAITWVALRGPAGPAAADDPRLLADAVAPADPVVAIAELGGDQLDLLERRLFATAPAREPVPVPAAPAPAEDEAIADPNLYDYDALEELSPEDLDALLERLDTTG